MDTKFLWVGAGMVAAVVLAPMFGIWLELGEMSPQDIGPFLDYFNSLVGIVALIVAVGATLAAAHSARRTGQMVELSIARDKAARQNTRKGNVLAVVGAATAPRKASPHSASSSTS